jgi:DNA-binding MarR family transcriptional regulator
VGPFALLTNHCSVLLCIAEDPRLRMREIAASVEITECAAQRIVADLIAAGYVERSRDGRRNVYSVRRDRPVTLPKQRAVDLNALLAALLPATCSGAHSDELESSPVSGVA